MMKNKEKILNWYHSETEKDSVELEKTKNNTVLKVFNVIMNCLKIPCSKFRANVRTLY